MGKSANENVRLAVNLILSEKAKIDIHQNRMGTSPIPTLFDVIGAFKSITTNNYINGVK